MANELEAKLKVASHDAVRQKLRSAGAKFVGKTHEVNAFFDSPDESLRNADRGLRLRINRDAGSGKEQGVVTMKGPQQSGQFKNREEIETDVSDPAAMTAIFEKLGFARMVSFEKRRESWKLNECKIELDEVPHLGLFVEIEGSTEAEIESLRAKLGLQDVQPIKTSYIAMLTQWLREHGDATRDIRFPA